MKRNPHIIVQQVCPMKKTGDGKYEVQAAIVHHKGIIARYRMEYPTKRHARWAFMVSNDCSKCIHFPNKYPGWKCVGCKWDISYKNVKSRWEPRKEEENETDA